jgi:hypothetical protein
MKKPLLLAALVGALAAGCTNPGAPTKPAPGGTALFSASARVDEISLVTMPAPVNLESLPGLDGVAVKVYAVDYKLSRTQPIRSGSLAILMYDGLVRGGGDETNKCRHQWTFAAQELPPFAMTTSIGTGYSFRLGWGKDTPQQERITLVARYQPPKGRPVYSAPSYLPVPGPPAAPPIRP